MNATEWKLGKSTGDFSRELLESLARASFDCIEVGLGTLERKINWKELIKNSRETGIELWSCHLPFCPFEQIDLSSDSLEKRQSTVNIISEYIRNAGNVGIKYGVLHSSGEIADKNMSRQLRNNKLNWAGECLAKLTDVAKEAGMTLAVEDLPRGCIGNCTEEIEKLISYHPDLRICLDVNHLLRDNPVDFIKKLGDKIVTLHITDCDHLNDRHWLPYEGNNDWVGIVSALENAGYNGPWIYEIAFEPENTIDRRLLKPEDFRENYLCCVNKRPAPVLGSPNEHRNDWLYYENPPEWYKK